MDWTNETLRECCTFWQQRLKLQDWNVKVRLARFYDFEMVARGRVDWTLETREASIILLDPGDYDPGFTHAYDVEQTLIHELLHLHCASFQPPHETLEHTAMEQMIDALAKAFVVGTRWKAVSPCQ